MSTPPVNPSAPTVTKALQVLQFLYNALPSQLRLILAQSVAEWAERAKAQALAEMTGGLPPMPHDFTVPGHSP